MTFRSATQMVKIAIGTNLYDSCETYFNNPPSFLSLEFLPSKSRGAFNTAHSFASENKLPQEAKHFPVAVPFACMMAPISSKISLNQDCGHAGTDLLSQFKQDLSKTKSHSLSLSPLCFLTENPVNICAFSEMALQPLSCTHFSFRLFCHPHLGILPLIQISTLVVDFFSSRVCDLY